MLRKDPHPGDITEPSKIIELTNGKNRSGLAYIVRKGSKFHSAETFVSHKKMANIFGKDETIGSHGIETLKKLTDYEYFLSYDPYTYFTYAAAMMGCIAIVYPLPTHTKEQWLIATEIGQYLLDMKLPME